MAVAGFNQSEIEITQEGSDRLHTSEKRRRPSHQVRRIIWAIEATESLLDREETRRLSAFGRDLLRLARSVD
jgi:hypothetical protein